MTVYQPQNKLGGKLAAGIIAAAFVLWCGGVTAFTDLGGSGGGKTPPVSASRQGVADTNPTDVPAAVTTTQASPAETTVAPTPTAQPTPGPQRTTSKPTQRPTAKSTTSTPKPKATTAKPKPKPTTAKSKPPALPVVHPGSFCSTQGARGVSKKGKVMVCTTTAEDPKKRWRAA